MVRLRKLLLNAPPQQVESSFWQIDFPDADLVVILGGNGCGKTLFVRILQNLLAQRTDHSADWPSDFESAHLEIEVNQEIRAIETDFHTRTRKVWTLPSDGHKSEDSGESGTASISPFGVDGAILSQTFLVADGRLGVDFKETLLKDLAEVALRPLQEARGEAQEMLQRISASLLEREEVLARTESQLDHLKQVLLQIEENRSKRHALDEEIHQCAGELRKLQQQRERSLYRKGLTERLNILASWLAEVAREREVVESLREQHVNLLDRFEDSYVPFRGLPEDFGERLRSLMELQERQNSISSEIQRSAEKRHQKESELAGIREKRRRLEEEQQNRLASLDENHRQIAEIQEQLKSLHRAHLELEGKKELKQRLLDEAVGDSSVSSLELLEKGRRLSELVRSCQRLAQQRESCEERWLALYERERMQVQSCELGFPGFDSLPTNAGELLPGMYRACGELRDSERQITRTQHQLAHFHRHPHITAAGSIALLTALLGFGAGIVLADWALGLFLALMISGISLLVFGRRLAFPPRIENRLKAEIDMLRNQWKKALDLRDELEHKLKPLLNYPDLASALKSLHNYENQRAKLQAIRNDLITCEAEAAALPSLKTLETEMAALSGALPEKLHGMPPEHLVRHLEACVQLEEGLGQISTELVQYKARGEKYLEMTQLSAEMSELEGREANERILQEQTRRGIEDLFVAEQQLQSELRDDVVTNLICERAELEAKFDEELGENAAHVGGEDLSVLWKQWEQMVDLRAQLRAVRGELSAHPTLDELGCREQILRAEISPLQAEIVGSGAEQIPDPESLDEQINHCESEMARWEQMRKELPLSLEEIGYMGDVSLGSLTAEAEQRQQELLALKKRREELEHGMAGIEAAIAEKRGGLAGEILKAASALLISLTEGKVQEILWEPDGSLSIVNASQRTLPVERLSGGLCDLVMFALRIAMIEGLEISDMPLVLDDPFGRLDSEHLTRMREVLARLSQRHQVILLSRDSRYGAWGSTVLLRGYQGNANGDMNMESG